MNERKLDAVLLGELDERLLALTDGEDVAETSGKGLALAILDVSDLVGTWVLLDVHEGADATNIVTTGKEDSSSIFEFHNAVDFTSLKVKLSTSK